MTGAIIRQVRRMLDKTQEEFAEEIGFSVIQLIRYERGKQQVPVDVASQLAAYDARIAEARCSECPLYEKNRKPA